MMSPLQISHEQTMSQRGGTTNSKLLLDIIILHHENVLSAHRLSVLGFMASCCKTSVVSDRKREPKKCMWNFRSGGGGNVLFNDALNTFYLRLYGVGHNGKVPLR